AQNLLNTSFDPQLQAKANLLNAGLAMLNHDYDKVIEQSNKAIAATSAKDPENIRLSSYQMLSRAYEAKQQPTFALAALKQYQGLFYTKLAKFNAVNEDIFKQQKDIIEKSLHYSGLEKRIETANDSIAKYQRLTLFGVTITCVIFLMLIRRIFSNKNTRQELQKQTQQLYTHPRTGLQNLRMLNAKLPNSLLQSSTILEQWRLGELIDEPLTDRLHFVLFDIPQLREYYLTQGYNNGLKLEKALGEHLNKQVDKPARIYHFSETSFLYITPQQHPALTPEDLFEKVKAWLAPFETIQQPLNMGIINYPFLSKAFTAINAQELIDILLSAISLADKVSALPDEANQQWVHIHAIDNAPAASFASKHIRQACLKSMQQGLVKLASSAKNEEALREVYMDILSQYQPKSSTQTNAKDN
ncbi:MAG: tetratricopeptide repeat protein, partial [Vibrio sp.]